MQLQLPGSLRGSGFPGLLLMMRFTTSLGAGQSLVQLGVDGKAKTLGVRRRALRQ